MNELKQRYNNLLENYMKGNDALVAAKDKPEEEKKVMEGLAKLQKQMEDLLLQIGEYTPEDAVNGFDLSENLQKEEEVVSENLQDVKQEMTAVVKTTEIHERGMTIRSEVQFDMFNKDNIERAKWLAQSTIIPKTYQENPQNILLAMAKAFRHNLAIDTVMNNLYMVNGSPVWKGTFYKTLIGLTGKYRDLEPVFVGEKGKDTYGCYIRAMDTQTGEIVEGEEVTIQLAKDEGWYGKTGSKWKTMPKIMMTGRAYSFFAKIYTPEVLDGILTDDEVEDITSQRDVISDVL